MVNSHSKTIGAHPARKGFTLAELMIATTVLALLITFAAAIYNNFFGTVRNLQAANLVYDEARFSMERISQEIRNGTIDYEEYYNQKMNFFGFGENKTYGQNYCQYSRQFYTAGPDDEFGTLDDESTGVRSALVPPPLGRLKTGTTDQYEPDPFQSQLLLIDINGRNRTYIKRVVKNDTYGNPIGRIGMIKLVGEDWGGIDHIPGTKDEGENDGRIDTWHCADGFHCCEGTDPCHPEITPEIISDSYFVDITPSALDIVDLKFIIAPMDDPRKAYNTPDDQIQPHVTIRLTARANPRIAGKLTGSTPNIVLDSTISARAYNGIITECNVKECLPDSGKTKACPKTQGVCSPKNPLAAGAEPAQQECKQFVFAGCTAAASYIPYSDTEYGQDSAFPGGTRTYYEDGSEFASCDVDLLGCSTACGAGEDCKKDCRNDATDCKDRRCTDGLDNDCNGPADADDPVCKQQLCNNGNKDSGEACIDVGDVGSICYYIRPLEKKDGEPYESSCFDGYDNDCDGFADQYDKEDCVEIICNNGILDPQAPYKFLGPSYTLNQLKPKNYLLNAEDTDYEESESLNETCIDVGGICGATPSFDQDKKPTSPETSSFFCKTDPQEDPVVCQNRLCSDGKDNDCDGKADELDEDCLASICTDITQNCDLVPKDYTPADYLVSYRDGDSPACLPLNLSTSNRNDEYCKNVGGLCDGLRGSVSKNNVKFYVDHNRRNSETDISSKTKIWFETGGVLTPDTFSDTTAKDLCNDGLDNDCNGLTDWEDPACCPNSDGDEFLPGGTFDPNGLCSLPQNTPIDCNDESPSIFPDDPTGFEPQNPRNNNEKCDGKSYPLLPDADCPNGVCAFPASFNSVDYSDYKEKDSQPVKFPASLRGSPIDSNCGGANGWAVSPADSDDPACCVDMDGDGYGITDAYLFAVNCPGEPRIADCNDFDKTINPGADESGSEKCSNEDIDGKPVNDNCNTVQIEDPTAQVPGPKVTVDLANHIDRYKDKTPGWFKDNFQLADTPVTGGIAMAFLLRAFEPACCTGIMEICNDTAESDENCNGREGEDDDYCLSADSKSFFDNFLTDTFISQRDPGIDHDKTAGSFLLQNSTFGNATVTSNTILPLKTFLDTCVSGYELTLIPDMSSSFDTSIDYQVSGDDGTAWTFNLPAGNLKHSFTPGNTKLKWRAIMNSSSTESNVPVLRSIKLTASCLP